MPVSKAAFPDIPAIVKVVNSAYRGEASRKGWTTEADLLKGNLRTDAAAIEQLMADPHSVILKYTTDEGIIAGTVYLQRRNKKCYLGMLSVDPLQQASGIGKLILHAATAHASQSGCTHITMTVISVRHELIAWYEKQGYKKTGIIKPFEVDEKFGVPTQPLFFEVLEKQV